jgi:hypothetical protein
MFTGHAEAVAEPVGFGVRTARMLMQIAEHKVIGNRNHGSELPPSWRTLYELTKVPEPELRRALSDGRIAANLTRRHLDESQRAMVAAKLATLREGRPTKETASTDAVSQPEAAKLLNVARAQVQRARVVRDHGAPELVKAVEQRRFVLWWDQQEKRRHVVNSTPSRTTDGVAIADFGLDRDTLHRWRRRPRKKPLVRGIFARTPCVIVADGAPPGAQRGKPPARARLGYHRRHDPPSTTTDRAANACAARPLARTSAIRYARQHAREDHSVAGGPEALTLHARQAGRDLPELPRRGGARPG